MAQAKKRRPRIGLVVLALLGSALLGVLTWQQIFYRGLILPIGEWQFGAIDSFFPLLTVMALALIAALPALLLLVLVALWRRRRRRHDEAAAATVAPPVREAERRLRRAARGARRMARLMAFAALLSVAGCIGAIVLLTRLPDENAPLLVVDAATQHHPREGPARLVGRPVLTQVAVFSRQVLLLRRDLFVMPVAPPRGQPVRFFVEVDGLDAPPPDPAALTGMLVRGGLPRPLAVLYRDHGVMVASNPYVLYNSSHSLVWPYEITAFQLAVTAIGSLLFWWLFHWRLRRIRETASWVEAET